MFSFDFDNLTQFLNVTEFAAFVGRSMIYTDFVDFQIFYIGFQDFNCFAILYMISVICKQFLRFQ